jgi:(1->4)-alpha-D-glucan 1-alpha-D-glucosylmutase
MADGRVKLYLTTQGLRLRQRRRELFAKGTYLPLTADGPGAHHAVAFLRGHEGQYVLTFVPRLLARVLPKRHAPDVFKRTFLRLPESLNGLELRDVLTGRSWTPRKAAGGIGLSLAELLEEFPVSILETVG